MTRPKLNQSTSAKDFAEFYWLKQELVDFCRSAGMPTSGAKTELASRIEAFLRTGRVTNPRKKQSPPSKATPLPARLTRKTIIGAGWRCSEALRAFFESEAGPTFHFNGAMRDFIRDGKGKTLGDAIAVWKASVATHAGSTSIAPQFEYNRHMRAFHQANPGKTHQDAIAAWKAKRAKRKTG